MVLESRFWAHAKSSLFDRVELHPINTSKLFARRVASSDEISGKPFKH
jgi:hypothetical protein